MTPVAFHFITPVWGEEYTRQFLNVSLPCQLSSGNLGYFRGRSYDDKYKIYTTSKDAGAIKEAPVFSKLNEIIHIEIHLIDDVIEEINANKGNKYDLLTICHSRGIEDAVKDQAAFVSLCADMVFSDGSFANLLKIASSGKRLVAIGSYRVTRETFIPALLENFYSPSDYCIAISSRELVQLSLDHIHLHTKVVLVNAPRFSDIWPAHIYWEVKGEGLIQRGIHLHPILINPSSNDALLSPSSGMGIDGYDYMQRVVPDFNDVYVVDDSDELTCLSIHPLNVHTTPYPYKFSSLQVASWVKKYCSQYHINFLNTKIRFHSGELSAQWNQVEQASDKVIDNIFACLEFFDKVPDVFNEIETHRVDCNSQSNTRTAEIEFLKKDDALAHIRLGIELKNQVRLKEAAEAFLHAIKLIPNDPVPYNQLGIVLYQLKDIKRAENVFRSAIKVSPTNVDAYVNLAEVCSTSQRYSEAIEYLKQATRLAPDDIEILTSLGTLGRKLGDRQALSIALERLRVIQPGLPMLQTLQQTLGDMIECQISKLKCQIKSK